MQRDSFANTFLVSVGVCLVCSFAVTAAAVGLRDLQEENAKVDRMKNILLAAGIDKGELSSSKKIKTLFGDTIETELVDLRTGEVVSTDAAKEDFLSLVTEEGQEAPEFADAVAEFDPIKAADEKGKFVKLSKKDDVAGLKTLENYSKVFKMPSDSGTTYIFPIRGRGLWSTLKGFIALEEDLNTVKGLTYYEHGETPGLGGEVDNPTWKGFWPGKKLYQDGDVKLQVVKGSPVDDEELAKYQVDGLAGATITSNGVSKMLAFWFSDAAFKKYIESEQK